MENKTCTIRKDIQEKSMSVPIGNHTPYHSDDDQYYSGSKPLPYKWEGDDKFFVFHKGTWKEAESIDWDFN